MDINKISRIKLHLENLIKFITPNLEFANCHMVNYFKDNLWLKYIPHAVRTEINEHSYEMAIENYWMVWNKFITVESVNRSSSIEPLIEMDKFKYMNKYLYEFYEHSIDNLSDVWLTLPEYYGHLKKNCKFAEGESNLLMDDNNRKSRISIKEFISIKKNHEVEITSELIHKIAESYEKQERMMIEDRKLLIIDAGDGKGYLSSRLAMEYQRKVIGIDANQNNSISAQQRNVKLNQIWKNLTKQPSNVKLEKPMPELNNQHYKTLTHYIKSDTNLLELIENCKIYADDNEEQINNNNNNNNNDNHWTARGKITPSIFLCGLHTCGNLSPTSLKLYTNNDECQLLCNIGCCYHLLKEEFPIAGHYNNYENKFPHLVAHHKSLGDTANAHQQDDEDTFGFPISKFLCEQKFTLGRNARMLSSQSISRTIKQKIIPNEMLWYRAVFEMLYHQYVVEASSSPSLSSSVVEEGEGETTPELQQNTINSSIQIGKIKNCHNFNEYTRIAAKRLNIHRILKLSDDEIEEFSLKYQDHQIQLKLFYLLRQSLAATIETIILLDRLLYLHENNFNNSYLIKLFDPVVSPRCFAIVSNKNN